MEYFKGKKVLVTGCCGTVGTELIKQLVDMNCFSNIVGIDSNESELFFIDQQYIANDNVFFFIADIKDRDKLIDVCDGIDIIFHTAAYKHVILCERSPFAAVQTNIMGVNNVITAAIKNNVGKVIFTSSDKAVNPTNVMGTSKLMGERLITAANSLSRQAKPIFASTRFGNVLGSRGSVIPIFKQQIERGGPVTITDMEMTRFIMSIEEAVRLVIDSARLACGGEVFVTKMPVIRIADLAKVMIDELAEKYGHDPESIKTEIIGAKPGEKLYEELMNTEEVRRTWELERYFTILPAFKSIYRDIDYTYDSLLTKDVTHEYNSANEKHLSREQLLAFLKDNCLLC